MSFLLGGLVGLVVGWLVPQPQWFKDLLAQYKGSDE